ncbi:MAG: ArsA family ATPase [Promethearchaeota archaeon]
MALKDLLLSLNMIMFGGKGGVGKTSCAAAAAIWAAEHGRRTLIISTDPAHSLGDSLGQDLPPGLPTPVNGIDNLYALEIDPKASIEEYKRIANINPMDEMGLGGANTMMGNIPMMGDMEDLSDMNPPGIDEAFAFAKVLEFIETEHGYDLIVFDTAPTGHTLRFLGLPETLSGWIGKLLRLRLKLSKFLGAFKKLFGKEDKTKINPLEQLERLNESISRAREDLSDPLKNSFVIVMNPEEMAIAETGRLLNELLKYNIPVSEIVINKIYQDSDELCDFCRARREMQQKNLEKIRSIFRNRLYKNLIEVPLFKWEVREYDKLKELGKYLIESS